MCPVTRNLNMDMFSDNVLSHLVLIYCKEGIYKMDVFNFAETVSLHFILIILFLPIILNLTEPMVICFTEQEGRVCGRADSGRHSQ